jgi:hypothetical protein
VPLMLINVIVQTKACIGPKITHLWTKIQWQCFSLTINYNDRRITNATRTLEVHSLEAQFYMINYQFPKSLSL